MAKETTDTLVDKRVQKQLNLSSTGTDCETLEIFTTLHAQELDLGHTTQVFWVMHVVLILDDLIVLIHDFESLLRAIISTDDG